FVNARKPARSASSKFPDNFVLHRRNGGADDLRASSIAAYAYRPWQCLYFLPEPHGQSSLRPTLPQVAGFLGSRLAPAVAVGTSEAFAKVSSPVLGSNLCASIAGNSGCCSSGGTISTRI